MSTETYYPTTDVIHGPAGMTFSNDWRPMAQILFNDSNGNQVGKISWKGGVLKFEGNVDESAKIFFERVLKLGPVNK